MAVELPTNVAHIGSPLGGISHTEVYKRCIQEMDKHQQDAYNRWINIINHLLLL